MLYTFYIFLLVALVKTLVITRRPGLCAGIHVVGHTLTTGTDLAFFTETASAMTGQEIGFPWLPFLGQVALWSAWGYAWFYALDVFDEYSAPWLATLVVGLLLRFVPMFL